MKQAVSNMSNKELMDVPVKPMSAEFETLDLLYEVYLRFKHYVEKDKLPEKDTALSTYLCIR